MNSIILESQNNEREKALSLNYFIKSMTYCPFETKSWYPEIIL